MLQSCSGCSDASALRQVHQVHTQIIVNGFSNLGFLQIRVLGVYVVCRSLGNAVKVFLGVLEIWPKCSAGPWNWMIRGFAMMGWLKFSILVYFKMLGCGVLPDKYTFPYVIKACNGLSNVKLGRLVHENVCSMGLEMDVFVGSSLVKMYAENGLIDEARNLFDKIPMRDCVLWNVMLNGYVRNGELKEVIRLFGKMRLSEIKPDYATFACVLSVCATEKMVEFGMQIHGLALTCGLDTDSPVANTLLAMYSKCKCLYDARRLFDMMRPQAGLVTWNGMIAGYVQNGFMNEARVLFRKLLVSGIKPDPITFASFLPSVSDSSNIRWGKEIYGNILRHEVCLDAFLKSALIDIFFKCRGIDMACKVYRQTDTVDVVICTAMVSGYVLNGMYTNALEIFRTVLRTRMRPNSVTLASIVPALAGLTALKLGKELHGYILKNDEEGKHYVASALTDMYAKCGRLDVACEIFGRMTERDSVAWNSMITSFCQNGKPEEAINLFRQMGSEGTNYDCVTISATLSACANLPALRYGKEIHSFTMKGLMRSDLFIGSGLIDMYAKCGNLIFARRVFDLMKVKNEISWNSMIAAYGVHGHVNEALDLFHNLHKEGIQPDHITFLAVISACSHAGLVDKGYSYFQSMKGEYKILARVEHYACMVDLFGRAGRLDEALRIIKSMPFDPDAGIWGTLLGASRLHGDVKFAEIASENLLILDPQNSGYYMLMANVHADAGEWNGVHKIRSMMKKRGVQKLPGCSWI
ncbi:hypothetical protein GIB67_031302 [Kingdonia uniflora]|uniref:Pentatricopeptide repeat-containing protein n=1 Tax=Kingdonia uniflora TaxID=39325 RepID=A0A7J7P6H7_9MAGN|nr:hypothetical protein GIB67_031302 [Kingdonia uniflora]